MPRQRRLPSRTPRRGLRTPPSYQTLRSGPYKRVLTTNDPLDDDPADLMDLVNGYIPDAQDGSGIYARPGAICQNHDNQLGSDGFRTGQGIYTHTDLTGVAYNFCVVGGKLYRASATFGLTDVTPMGVTIDRNRTTRVFFASLDGSLVVSDGVSAPWIASNLSSTPITATPISFSAAAGTNWSAFGRPRIWGGALFVILNQVGGTSARATIAWSEPGDPSIGYRQTNFANYWTFEQTQQGPASIYAMAPTEVAMFVFREGSITSFQGEVGPNLSSQATTDTISVNIGALASAGIQQFGNTIFFADQLGRPWAFTPGNTPQDLWKQLRAIVDDSTIGFPSVTAVTTTAAIESTLNLYLLASWSPRASSIASPTQVYAFDARSGSYQGRWQFGGSSTTTDDVWGVGVWADNVWGLGVWGGSNTTTPASSDGISIDALGTWQDPQGRGVLVILGSEVPGGSGGFVWTLQSVSGIPDNLAKEAGGRILRESGGSITTEGQPEQWMDGSRGNLVTPLFQATTNRFGYSDDTVWNADLATIIAGTDSPIAISAGSTAVDVTLEGTPTPLASFDKTYRLLVGLEGIQGRGIAITVAPSDASTQRIIQSIAIRAVPSLAGPEDA